MDFEALKTGDTMLMRGPKHGNAFGNACLPDSVPEALSGYFGSSCKDEGTGPCRPKPCLDDV
jgi:hypothetical protein